MRAGYVEGIACWSSGAPVEDGQPPSCAAGDFPEVRYDLARLAREVDRDELACGPASLWRYAPLLSPRRPEDAVTLGEGWTPLVPLPRLGEALGCARLWAKDEGRNPSGTFKDRGASVALTRLRELGIRTVVHNTSGNAGGAWGLYAARAGIRCINLMPSDVLPASLRQSTLSGAETILLDGPWQEAGPMAVEAAGRNGWHLVSTLKEPHRLEGKKTMGLEIAEQLGWRLPDAIFYPTGGGLGAIAIYKAFRELRELGWIAPGPLPKLIVTQYAGCAPIVRAFERGGEQAEPWEELDVPPGGLKSVRPPGDRAVLRLVRETGGTAVAVSSKDAADAVADVASREGLLPAPEAGTTIAGLRKALAAGVVDPGERIVLMFTGSGLKSVPILPDGPFRTVTVEEEIAA